MNLSFVSASCFLLGLSWSLAAACAAVPASQELVPRPFRLLRLPSTALRAQEWLGQDLVGRRSREVLLSPVQDALQTRKKSSPPIRREFGQDKYQLLPKAMPGAGCAEVARCGRRASRAAVTAPRFPAPARCRAGRRSCLPPMCRLISHPRRRRRAPIHPPETLSALKEWSFSGPGNQATGPSRSCRGSRLCL